MNARSLLPGVFLAFSVSMPFAARGADAPALPEPAILISGDKVNGTELQADRPSGLTGVVEGSVRTEGGELVFDGDGGKIVFDYDMRGIFGFPFTVAAFVESGPPIGYGEIIRSGAPRGFSLRTSSHGFYAVSTNGEWNTLGSPSKSVVPNARQHIAVVYDGSQLIMYIDGAEVARKEIEQAPQADMTFQVGDTGRTSDTGELTDVPNFRLSQLAVFDSALTPEQIVALSRKR